MQDGSSGSALTRCSPHHVPNRRGGRRGDGRGPVRTPFRALPSDRSRTRRSSGARSHGPFLISSLVRSRSGLHFSTKLEIFRDEGWWGGAHQLGRASASVQTRDGLADRRLGSSPSPLGQRDLVLARGPRSHDSKACLYEPATNCSPASKVGGPETPEAKYRIPYGRGGRVKLPKPPPMPGGGPRPLP